MDVFTQQLVNGIIIGLIYALMAIGLTLIFGILKILNFAHGEIYMLGAFGVHLFTSRLGLNYFLSIVLTILCVCILGYLFEKVTVQPLLNKDLHSSLLTTFALGLILMNSVQIVFGATPQSVRSPIDQPFNLGNVVLTGQKTLIMVLSVFVIASLALFIKYSRWGKILRATSQNQMAATIVGIHTKQVYAWTFSLSAGLAALAGSLLAPIMSVYPSMGAITLIKSFVVVILGGLGSLTGAIAGGLFLGIAEAMFSSYVSSGWKDVLGYIILVIVLIFMPQGLFGRSR